MKMDLRCGETDACEISTTARLRVLLRESEEKYRTLHASISAILTGRIQLQIFPAPAQESNEVKTKMVEAPILQSEKVKEENEVKTKVIEVPILQSKREALPTSETKTANSTIDTKHSQSHKQISQGTVTKVGDIYTFHCIHCNQALQLEKPHMQHQPIRCAVYKHNGAVVEVSISDNDCKILHDSGRIYGCGKLMILDTLILKITQ